MNIRQIVARVFVAGVLSIAFNLGAYGNDNPQANLPPEIRELKENDLTDPAQTILDCASDDTTLIDTVTASVWLRFKTDSNDGVKEVEVVHVSHSDMGLEDQAIAALHNRIDLHLVKPTHRSSKWHYHEVIFNHISFSRRRGKGESSVDDISAPSHEQSDLDKQFGIPPHGWDDIKAWPAPTYVYTPKYPKKALKRASLGLVWVKALVDSLGYVARSEVRTSSGDPVLDSTAVRAAYKNRFKPAVRENGQKVACWVTYRVNFQLE